MAKVMLHYRADRLHKTCVVCGADFARHGQTDWWWLRNTWTDRRDDYHEGEGGWPGDWMVPCGRLPDDSMTPNVGIERRPRRTWVTAGRLQASASNAGLGINVHTHHFMDREDDCSAGKRNTGMHINGDFSGDVMIVRHIEGGRRDEISLPYWQLRALVAEEVRAKRIADAEQADPHELLGVDA